MAKVVLQNVVKTCGTAHAVNDLSFTVEDGEFVALVGPSGCGKTTTLNLIAGLIPMSGGDILIGDRLVNDLDPKDRDIAMVFQNYALYPNKTVFKNLAFPLQMRTELERFHQDLNATVIYVTHDPLEAVTMADKMAVMNGGSLQQYDSPKNVFDHPVNTFVASFVGSPAMSLVPLRAATSGDAVALAGSDWTLPLSPANTRKVLAASSDKLILGARHSTIRMHHAPAPGLVPGRVYTVEPTGDVTFVQVHVDGSIVIVSLDPDAPVRTDTNVWLEFDQNRLHLFDGVTQMALPGKPTSP